MFNSASAFNPKFRQVILTVGDWYRISLDIDTFTSGSMQVQDLSNGMLAIYTTTGTKISSSIAVNTTFEVKARAAGTDVTVDNVSVKQLALADLLRLASTSNTDVIVRDDLTITDQFQAGIGVRWDSQSSPANGIIAYFDRGNSEKVIVGKYVAGTYGEVSATAATYSAGAKLEVRLIGTEVHVKYNNAHVVTNTVSDAGIVSNTLHGLFGTENATTHEKAQAWPVDAINYDKYFA